MSKPYWMTHPETVDRHKAETEIRRCPFGHRKTPRWVHHQLYLREQFYGFAPDAYVCEVCPHAPITLEEPWLHIYYGRILQEARPSNAEWLRSRR